MRIKFKKKTILAILMISIISIFSVSVFGEITPGEVVSEDIKLFSEVLFGITKVISFIGGILLTPLLMLAIAIAAIITLIFGTVCTLLLGTVSGGEDNVMFIPFADQIIFNKLAAFDPNFINPAKSHGDKWSLIELMSKIVSPLYFTGQTVVGGVFIILALVIGIKLAISATAQEKAQYKSAITTWVFGIFFLLVGHIYMSAVFTINESVVATVAKSADKVVIPIAMVTLEDLSAVWGAIKQIGANILNIFRSEDNQIGPQYHYRIVSGYSGLFYFHMLNSIANRSFASLLMWYILIGQTVALIVLYFKRVFLAIFLGIIFPFTVAFDTLQKISGKNTNLLGNWFKNFTINVFSQTFHAFIIYFSLILMSQLIQVVGKPPKEGVEIVNPEVLPSGSKIVLMDDQKDTEASASMVSILQIVAIMSVVSLEKLVKEFTGISTGKLGNVSQNGLQMVAATGTAMKGVRNLADNVSGLKEAAAKRNQARMARFQAYNQLNGKKPNDTSGIPKGLINGNNKIKKKMEAQQKNINQYDNMFSAIASRKKGINGGLTSQNRGIMGMDNGTGNPMNNPFGMANDKNGIPFGIASGSMTANLASNGGYNNSLGGINNVSGNMQSVNTHLNKAKVELDEIEKLRSSNLESSSSGIGLPNSSGNVPSALRNVTAGNTAGTAPKLKEVATPEEQQKLRDTYIKAYEEEKKATKNFTKKAMATALTPGITIASIGVGMGTANSIDDVFRVSGFLATALDGAVEKGAEKALNKMPSIPFEVKLKDSNMKARTVDQSTIQKTITNNNYTTSSTNITGGSTPSASRAVTTTKEVAREVETRPVPRQRTEKYSK